MSTTRQLIKVKWDSGQRQAKPSWDGTFQRLFLFGEVTSTSKSHQDKAGRLHVRLISRGHGLHVHPNESGERWVWIEAFRLLHEDQDVVEAVEDEANLIEAELAVVQEVSQ